MDSRSASALRAVLFDPEIPHTAKTLYSVFICEAENDGCVQITYRGLAARAGIDATNVARALQPLIARRLITQVGEPASHQPTVWQVAALGSHHDPQLVVAMNTNSYSSRLPSQGQEPSRARGNSLLSTTSISNTEDVDVPRTPSETTVKPKTERKPSAPAARTPNRSAQVIDALRALGCHDPISGRDHGAIKASDADPTLIAEAYLALKDGRWHDDFLRRRLSLHVVIDNLPAYVADRDGVQNGQRPAPKVSVLGNQSYTTEDLQRQFAERFPDRVRSQRE